jgi:proline iminopeptidase
MSKIILSLFYILTTFTLKAQITTIYSKAYGLNTNPVVIFIHGGPSGNSTLFEATTAKEIADRGFYVIVYDRRGEGRSIDSTATFTYQETVNDLDDIYLKYNLTKANLIGHSFGGLVATIYTDKNPKKVNSLILAGALFSQQQTYDHIIKVVKQICQDKKDTLMFSKVDEVEKLNKNSAEYRKGCFELASQNNFFNMPFPTNEATQLKQDYESSEFYKNNIRNQKAPMYFYKNELQNNIDTKLILENLRKKDVRLFAIYGQQDNIFSNAQLNDLKKIVKKKNFKLIDNCSHYLFVDQQCIFIDGIVKWIK